MGWLAHYSRMGHASVNIAGFDSDEQARDAPRTVHVPYVVERDEDGIWCAHAQLRPGVGAHGEGPDEASAVDDLREALTGLIEEFGIPRVMAVTVASAA